jgi:hypothetical protein
MNNPIRRLIGGRDALVPRCLDRLASVTGPALVLASPRSALDVVQLLGSRAGADASTRVPRPP